VQILRNRQKESITRASDAQSLDYETLESSASVVFIGADIAESGLVVSAEPSGAALESRIELRGVADA